MFEKEVYIKRRNALKDRFKEGIILIPGNNYSPMTFRDNPYPFLQDSTFSYYFGVNVPGLMGVIDVGSSKCFIFGKEYTTDDIIWMGKQKYLREYAELSGVNEFIDLDHLKRYISDARKNNVKVLFTNQYKEDAVLNLSELLDLNPFKFNDFISKELVEAIVDQRNFKSKEEILSIEDAVNVTLDMHLKALEITKAYKKEYEIVAEIESVLKKNNCYHSFQSIFSKRGEVLHNHNYGNELSNGDLILFDGGARNEEGYCGDVTTTFVVGGKFNERQKSIYNLVIDMFDKASSLSKPGIKYLDVHLEVCKTLTKGMIERGFMKGDVEEIVKSGAHALFMPHGLGHMMGLDVHDMENLGEQLVGYGKIPKSSQFGLSSLRLGRVLEENFVYTVEPGIYFIPELVQKWRSENLFKEFLNYEKIESYLDFGGIRYEKDFLITNDGCKMFGKQMPKTVEEVENKTLNKV